MSRKDTANQMSDNNVNSLCAGSKIKGLVSTTTNFRIDGEVEGDIYCKGRTVVGSKAIVVGDVFSVNMDIEGTVEGNITINESLCLKPTAVVKGNIITRKLVVESGAIFNGNCKMSDSIADVPDLSSVSL